MKQLIFCRSLEGAYEPLQLEPHEERWKGLNEVQNVCQRHLPQLELARRLRPVLMRSQTQVELPQNTTDGPHNNHNLSNQLKIGDL